MGMSQIPHLSAFIVLFYDALHNCSFPANFEPRDWCIDSCSSHMCANAITCMIVWLDSLCMKQIGKFCIKIWLDIGMNIIVHHCTVDYLLPVSSFSCEMLKHVLGGPSLFFPLHFLCSWVNHSIKTSSNSCTSVILVKCVLTVQVGLRDQNSGSSEVIWTLRARIVEGKRKEKEGKSVSCLFIMENKKEAKIR